MMSDNRRTEEHTIAVTTAFGTTASVVSLTVPEMLPVLAWPQPGSAVEIQATLANASSI
jgi:hypothetical protein